VRSRKTQPWIQPVRKRLQKLERGQSRQRRLRRYCLAARVPPRWFSLSWNHCQDAAACQQTPLEQLVSVVAVARWVVKVPSPTGSRVQPLGRETLNSHRGTTSHHQLQTNLLCMRAPRVEPSLWRHSAIWRSIAGQPLLELWSLAACGSRLAQHWMPGWWRLNTHQRSSNGHG